MSFSISEDTYGIDQIPRIEYQDESLLILFKPASWFVHPPENPRYRRGLKRRTCVQWLNDEHEIQAFPAHRLDAATEGLLVFGKTKEATANLNQQFRSHEVIKIYDAVVRGWFKEKVASIDLPLELDSTNELVNCRTDYRVTSEIELPHQVNSRFQTTRYSLLEIQLHTGRWHQIRRHMNRVAHPVLGDREHGDSHHNRFFRDQLKINGLCLRSKQLSFRHPSSGKQMHFHCPDEERWIELKKIFSVSRF